MDNLTKNFNQDCEICYKIICKGCGWTATDDEAIKVYNKEITACPLCGWQPKLPYNA